MAIRERMSAHQEYVVGFDIGGTKCATILGKCAQGGAMRIIDRDVFPTRGGGPDQVLERLFSAAGRLLQRQGVRAGAVRSVGISCGGPLDSKSGVVMSPPHLHGWDHVDIVQQCERSLGLPTRLENDATAGAFAEWKWGVGRGYINLIFLTVGSGFGAGLVLNGRLYRGTCDLAGEVGHVRLSARGPEAYGKEGSVEAYCSGEGIANLAREALREAIALGEVTFLKEPDQLTELTARDVIVAARDGDRTARDVIHTAAHALGQVLALLIDLFNPQIIALGGIYMRHEDLFRSVAMEVVEREALPGAVAACQVVSSVLGEEIGDYAALGVAVMPPDR